MFSLETDVLWSPWHSPLDQNYPTLFSQDHILSSLCSNISLFSPYRPDLDTLLDEFDKKLRNLKKDFTSQGDVTGAYWELYWFTQVQGNFVPYITQYKQNLEKLKLLEEILTFYTRANCEKEAEQVIEQAQKKRVEKNRLLDQEYPKKKDITTNEMKFITLKMNDIEKEMDLKIAPYTGQRAQYTIQTKIKSDIYINEIKRKILIVEGAIEYLEKLFKLCQEQVNTHKKIIENLIFLYNQSK